MVRGMIDLLDRIARRGRPYERQMDPAYIATEHAFKTLNLPSSFVIDRNGKIVLSWVGGINLRNLEKHVTPIIEEQS